jgi:hypothetical protein
MPGPADNDGEYEAKAMASWRLMKHTFVETPKDSTRDAGLFDFCEFPYPDPNGISETPVQAEVEVRPIVTRTTVGRAARAATEEGQRECQRECHARMSLTIPAQHP